MDDPRAILCDPALLEAETRRLRRLARALVSEDRADDVVQESLLALHLRSGRIRTSVRGWLAGVARHVGRDMLRAEGRRKAREERTRPRSETPAPEEVLERLDERREVLDALRDLSEPYRTALWLRYFEELPPRTIAARQGVPVETVKSRLKRGLGRLRRRLDRRHGGDRGRWRGALLPLAIGARHLPVALEVLVKKKVTAILAALLLILMGGVALYPVLTGGGATKSPGGPPAPAPGAVADGTSSGEGAGAGEGVPARGTGGETGRTETVAEVPPPEVLDPAAPVATDEPAEPPPAIRWNPMDPRLPPGAKPMGGGGPRMIGWSKFPPMPLHGRAAVEVLVEDSEGEPVAGAEVRIGPPGIVGESPISFAHLELLGKTGPDGRLRDGNLPAGGAGLFADLGGRLRRPRGADCTDAAKVVLRSGKTATATVRLSFAVGETGAVAGRVATPDGEPVAGASVIVGFHREHSGRDGSFRLANVPAGATTLEVSRYGYGSEQVAVEVPSGGVADVDVTLAPTRSGSFDLFGTVVGPAGAPVDGAQVYLMYEKGRGTLRSAVADAMGRFTMKALPDDVGERSIVVQASARGFVTVRTVHGAGLPGNEVALAFEERLVPIRIRATDAADGGPILVARFALTGEGLDRPKTSTGTSREGAFELSAKPGTYELEVEAPDHDVARRRITVPDDGSELGLDVELEPTPGPHGETILEVRVVSEETGAPVTNATVWILDRSGEPLRRVDGPRAKGSFPVRVPLGECRVKVEANGYETREQLYRTPPEDPPAPLTVPLDRE